MSKNVKLLIGCAVALCILLVPMILLLVNDKSDVNSSSDSSSSEATAEISMINEWSKLLNDGNDASGYTDSDVTSVNISNGSGDYSLIPDNVNSSVTALAFTLKGYEKYDMNHTVTDSVAKNILSMSLVSSVEEDAQDLSKYGLDNPQATAILALSDGKEIAFCIGTTTPSGENNYFCFKDSNDVYTVAATNVSQFLYSKENFVSISIVGEVADDAEVQLDTLKVTRTDWDYQCVYEPYTTQSDNGGTTAKQVMTSPIYSFLNGDYSKSILSGLFGLSASEAVNIGADDAALAEYGLDAPFCTVDATMTDGTKYELILSDANTDENGNKIYYGWLKGRDIIYSFSETSLPWTTMKASDGLSSLILATYAYDVKTLTVEALGQDTLNFECNASGSKDNFEVKKNGEDASFERFQKFYAFLLTTPAEEFYMGEITGDLIAKITVESGYEGEGKTIEFYSEEAGSRKVTVVVDGVVSFQCRASFVDVLKQNMSNYDTDSDFVTVW